jgi:hypothetical protein
VRRSPTSEIRYVLAWGDDAAALAELEGVTVLRRLPNVVLVTVDAGRASAIAHGDPLIHVYDSREDAMRAFSLFATHEG